MNNINTAIHNYMCSGCGTCLSVCPKAAITMQFDRFGFLRPIIDSQKCVNCSLCIKVCPGIQVLDFNNRQILKSRIGHSLNDEIYKNAQSGGLVTQTLSYLFEERLIDAAVVAHSTYGTKFPKTEAIIVTNPNELKATQKSIYTPIDMMSRLKDISHFKSVAIVGLPCQMEALHLCQQKGLYSNVKYRLGLICDRILSRYLTRSLTPQEIATGSFNVYYRYKTKDKGWNYRIAPICFEKSNGEKLLTAPYARHYLKDFYTPPRCRICFDKLNCFADIVFGDPWNMDNVDWENGDNLILTRNDEGEKIISRMKEKGLIVTQDCTTEDVCKSQEIENRIKRSNAACYVYREYGWKVPAHYISQDPVDRHQLSLQKKYIKSFLYHEKQTEENILKDADIYQYRNKKIHDRQRIKSRIKRIIKKILYIGK